MDAPNLEAFEDRELLGSGPCGTVFRARDPDGGLVAVKILDPAAVNHECLATACRRLERGEWPEGVLRVLAADFDARPASRVTPCLADADGEGGWVPRSLQHRLDRFGGNDSWSLVRGVLRGLAALHERGVVHGNLKPGNVFFDDEVRVLLSDWGLGNMPGVERPGFTDACLYQPPEQLRDPDGLERGEGFRWDVYAFGTLAYRILTGAFPRCDSTFRQVAPPNGATRREGVRADLGGIAGNLEAQPLVRWPGQAGTSLEKAFRGIIDGALDLDPGRRPVDAQELQRMFLEAESAVEESEQRDVLEEERRAAERRAARSKCLAFLSLGLAVVLGGLWAWAEWRGEQAELRYHEALGDLGNRIAEAEAGQAEAEQTLAAAGREAREAQAGFETREEAWRDELRESRAIGDRVLSWALDAGRKRVPALEGQEQRLAMLDRELAGFVERQAEDPELAESRGLARLQRAEIALAAGDPAAAEQRFAEWLGEGLEPPADGDFGLRLAADRLRLAILWHEAGNLRKAGEVLALAREWLERADDADELHLPRLRALVDLEEAGLLAAELDEDQALDLLDRATRNLSALSDHRPDLAILRSELAGVYLATAAMHDGLGEVAKANELRQRASVRLIQQIEARPEELALQIDLAGAYGAIAESAALGGELGRAEGHARAAAKLLGDLLPKRPGDPELRARLAAQWGILAGIERDRGNSEEAMKLYDRGLGLLGEGGEEEAPVLRFRRALLQWQKGRMLGFDGDTAEELRLEQKASAELQSLQSSDYEDAHWEQLGRARGYLLGDLGHAAQLGERVDLSRLAFEEAVEQWEALQHLRPEREEYREALEWNRRRLEDLE